MRLPLPAGHPWFRALSALLAGGALAAVAAACGGGAVVRTPDGVAPGQNVVAYYVRVARPGADRYEVTLAADGIRGDSLDFVLPAWAPGRYGIGPGRAIIENFVARDARGEPMATRRLGLTRWRLYPRRDGALTVGYLVVPGASTDPMPFRTRLDLHSGYATGAGLFGYLAGFERRPVTLAFDLPPAWRVTSALRPAGPNRYAAPHYAELPASNFILGDRVREYRLFVQGRPHQVAVQGAAPGFAPDSLLRLVDETIDYATRFLGPAPYERYLFALHFEPPEAGGFGASGHATGSSYFLPVLDGGRLREAGMDRLLLHQYLHAWLPGRFGPAELVRPDWSVNPSLEGYWFVEGAAEYYAHLLPVRYGTGGPGKFYESMGRLLTAWYDLGGGERIDPEALTTQARRDADETSLRRLLVGGALTTFLVDLTVLEETRGLRGLEQAIYYLQRWSPPEGYAPTRVWPEIASALGVSPSVFGPLTGAGPVSIDAGLARAGLRAVNRGEPDRLGARLEAGPGGRFVISEVQPGGTAARAGLRDGDRLQKIGATPIAPDEVVATRFALRRYLWDARPGATVTFEVERDGEVRELRGTVREVNRRRIVLAEINGAPAGAAVVRASLFRPTTAAPGGN